MIRIETHRLKLKYTWRIARGFADTKDVVILEIFRDGISGYGEAAPNTRYGESVELTCQRLESCRSILSSHDLFEFETLKAIIDQKISDQSCAKAAIDMAVLDWVGKKLSIPVFRLWGIDPSTAPQTSFSIGIDGPEMIRKKVREASDFPLLKIKVGTVQDEEIIAAVRDVTDKTLRVDANEGWTDREEALRKIEWLATCGVEYVEQPMPAGRLDDIAWLRERSPLPLVADEDVKVAADIPALAGIYDGINIKLMKSGGLLEGLRMVHTARACGLKIMLGCMLESSLGITAAAHLAPLVDWADLDSHLLTTNDPYVGMTVKQGFMTLPAGTGLGVVSAK